MLSTSPSSLTPKEARQSFRENVALDGAPSSGYCAGHLQANIVILPSSVADAFGEFCRLNRAPCPVLYRSKVGELDAPPIARGSDIRTDLTKYIVSVTTNIQKSYPAWELTEYPWDDMVTFYIGCSYSFENALINAGIPLKYVEENKHVAMFMTNIRCTPVGPFSCSGMVVSMRPVKKDMIEKAVEITAVYDAIHGAPVHIGDPELIGIADITKTIVSDCSSVDGDEVPVFWACGVTSSEAVRSCEPKICFSHSPGCMFICDVTCDEYFHSNPPLHDEKPKVVTLQDDPFFATLLGIKTFTKICDLEQIIQNGFGSRNKNGELVKAASRLSHSFSIGILTTFPIILGNDHPGPYGLSGVLAMAKALQALGKKVTLLGNHCTVKLFNQIVLNAMESGILKQKMNVEEFTPSESVSDDAAALKCLYPTGVGERPKFDVLVAIEVVGRECCQENNPVDKLLVQAGNKRKRSICTIAIVDRENEIRMGKVTETRHIKNNACNVAVDHMVTAAAANWGAWALAMSLFLLQNCGIHSRYRSHGIGEYFTIDHNEMLNSIDQERKLLQLLVSLSGVCDGEEEKPAMSVNDFESIHVSKLKEMFEVVFDQSN